MSSKTRMRNLALLGGLGAAAMMMGKKEGDKASDSQYQAQDMQEGPEGRAKSKPVAKPATRSAAPKVQKDEGATASGLPREARGVKPPPVDEGEMASGLPREARGRAAPVMEGATASGLPREARGVGPSPVIDRIRGGMKKGGMVGSASKRADGCAIKGKTRGRMV